MMEMDDMDEGVLEEKRMLLETAFPGQTFDDEQVEAFAEFVYLCASGEKDGPKSGKEEPVLELVFGAEPPKGKKK